MDIRHSYSCLLGRQWIHNAGAITSTLHQMLKYLIQGKIITVHGEEEYMINLLFISVEMALEQTIKSIQIQNAQLQDMFLNLSKGQEKVKVLLTRGVITGNPGDDRDD